MRLGLKNIFTVIFYRVRIKFNLHPVCDLYGSIPEAPFFLPSYLPALNLPGCSSWLNNSSIFSCFTVPLGAEAPNWLENPLTGEKLKNPLIPWWKIGDFDSSVGDIKLIWEYSRMEWAVTFAQRARNGDKNSLNRLNEWIQNWLENNPAYLGHNWKCGQEASIRVIHLSCAALILGQYIDCPLGLRQLIKLHLRRIELTLNYSIAQDNNHGTSEAAALFIGGSLLAASGSQQGEIWGKLGRTWLEDRAKNLIENDGSFSQYSVNYHRMMLDTYSFVEVMRCKLNLEPFSQELRRKLHKAADWLYNLVSPVSGDAPNIGANDGARLLPLTDASYRDFRPSVQLAMAIFGDQNAYTGEGLFNEQLEWLSVNRGMKKPEFCVSRVFNDGGYTVLRNHEIMLLFRVPRFKYRPGQADIFHIDLWRAGENIFCDAGTYSYNSTPDLAWYFSATAFNAPVKFIKFSFRSIFSSL